MTQFIEVTEFKTGKLVAINVSEIHIIQEADDARSVISLRNEKGFYYIGTKESYQTIIAGLNIKIAA
jgi:hypothetical protein